MPTLRFQYGQTAGRPDVVVDALLRGGAPHTALVSPMSEPDGPDLGRGIRRVPPDDGQQRPAHGHLVERDPHAPRVRVGRNAGPRVMSAEPVLVSLAGIVGISLNSTSILAN